MLQTTEPGGIVKEITDVIRRCLTAGIPLLALAGTLALSTPPATAAMTIASHPRIAAGKNTSTGPWSSSNWSGYAITGGTYTSITGSWKVAAVSQSSRQTFSSTWIGIDGFNDSNLIQTGTEADYYSGSAHYNAWWEILPAAETPISTITVHANDVMSASIQRVSGSAWTITIVDTTTGQKFFTNKAYSGPLSSAEWIEEAPSVGGRIATLAHYASPVAIDPGTVNGANPGFTSSESGVMVQHFAQVSTPSAPDSESDGFAMAYGSRAPSPPAS